MQLYDVHSIMPQSLPLSHHPFFPKHSISATFPDTPSPHVQTNSISLPSQITCCLYIPRGSPFSALIHQPIDFSFKNILALSAGSVHVSAQQVTTGVTSFFQIIILVVHVSSFDFIRFKLAQCTLFTATNLLLICLDI